MPRTLSTDMTEEKNKEFNRPVELYQIFLDEDTLYLAMYPIDIEFFDENGNPQTYSAAALSRNTVQTNVDTEVDQCQVTIDNVNREMSAYIANTEFVDRRIRILKVFLDRLDQYENHIVVFDGLMDSPRINQHQMSVNVVSKLDTLDRKLPTRIFSVQCPWQFGDEETCGISVPEIAGSINSLSSDNMIVYDNEITEEDDYWKFGEISIGKESRLITESGDGYVIVEYPFSANISAGDGYSIVAGCDKSYEGSHGCEHWDNTQYYGGFLTIPKNDIREVV